MISFIFGVKAMKLHEDGILKFMGISVISLAVFVYTAIILVMGIGGFGA